MNWQAFISLIQSDAPDTYFVPTTRHTDKLGRIVSALFNTKGGTIVIGYDRINSHLTGYMEADPWIHEFVANHFGSDAGVSVAFLFRSNKKIAIVSIALSPNNQAFEGVFYCVDDANKISPFIPASMPISDNSLHERQLTAIDHVMNHTFIKNSDYRELFSVSHKTAHMELAALVARGTFQTLGSGRSTRYVLASSKTFPSEHRLKVLFKTNSQLSYDVYANALNMDMAQAINDLQYFCDHGIIQKHIENNDTYFTLISESIKT
jgi:predicted HTH transcriptional regulator